MQDFFKDLIASADLYTLNITGISVSDIIDISITSFFIYKILIWIRETRAFSLIRGVVFIVIVSALAYIFRLNTIVWIVKNTYSIGLLAVIVLFQPEFRKALEEIGNRKNIISFKMKDRAAESALSQHTIDELIKASFVMSKAKTGALMLIQQNVALGELIKTGIPVDALVSSQLIINIFEHNTPLHDGAVIIRDNRVAAATCILPLTQDEIGRELGTRHRAAVGASELSDAIVIVVSEETGSVSIAKNGRLNRKLNENQMRAILETSSGAEERKRFVLWGKHREKKAT